DIQIIEEIDHPRFRQDELLKERLVEDADALLDVNQCRSIVEGRPCLPVNRAAHELVRRVRRHDKQQLGDVSPVLLNKRLQSIGARARRARDGDGGGKCHAISLQWIIPQWFWPQHEGCVAITESMLSATTFTIVSTCCSLTISGGASKIVSPLTRVTTPRSRIARAS